MEEGRIFAQESPSVGGVLRDTFTIFSSHMVQFGAIAALTLVPLGIAIVLFAAAASNVETAGIPNLTGTLVAGVLAIVLFFMGTQVATAAFTYGVFQVERGHEISVGGCLSVGLRRLPMVLLVVIVVGILTLLGMVACIIPGIIIALALSMAVPVTVVERAGIETALKRSVELTKGFRWTVLGTISVFGALQFVISLVVGLIGLGSQVMSQILSVLSSIVFAGLQATTIAVLYYRLRSARGAIDVDEIAAVFE